MNCQETGEIIIISLKPGLDIDNIECSICSCKFAFGHYRLAGSLVPRQVALRLHNEFETFEALSS